MKLFRIFFLTICFIIMCTVNVFAYLDPSTTTYVLQIFLAVIIGLATTIAMCFHKIKRFFSRKIKNNNDEDDE